jgi:hypothetical protein
VAAPRLLRQSQIPDWSGDEAATHRDAAGELADRAPRSASVIPGPTVSSSRANSPRAQCAVSARRREVGVATEMLLTKAEQVSDDGRASLSEQVRGLIIEPELAELSADLGRHLGEAGTFRDLSAIQAWGRGAT